MFLDDASQSAFLLGAGLPPEVRESVPNGTRVNKIAKLLFVERIPPDLEDLCCDRQTPLYRHVVPPTNEQRGVVHSVIEPAEQLFVLASKPGAVAGLVGIEGGVVSGVFNLESSSVEALDWRPRHDEQYYEA